MAAGSAGFRASLGAVAVALATSCGGGDSCARTACALSACLPPFTLGVTDAATSQGLSASATSAGLTCTAPAIGVVSCAAGETPGTYAVVVSAPGYTPSQVEVVVGAKPPPGECGCQTTCQSWQPQHVALAASAG